MSGGNGASGVYIGFNATPERVNAGCNVTICDRCHKVVGHWPQNSAGHEILCLKCGYDIPAIRKHIDQLAKERE